MRKIKSALLSVYYKDGLDSLVHTLAKENVTFYSTGGTQAFIEALGYKVIPVEDLTSYPSILGGRVKPCIQKYLVVFWHVEIMKMI